MPSFEHDTVLLNEAVEGLQIKPDGTYVDCTLGGAGHSQEILRRLNKHGHLYAFDQDDYALKHAKDKLSNEKLPADFTLIKSNFRHLKEELSKRGIEKVDGILFDLGVSSPQFDDAKRGFSYRFDAPLDMRMNQNQELTAKEIVNHWNFQELARVISRYGEERFAKQIARKIEETRKQKPIETTFELTEVIKEAIPAPARRKGGHPAKRTFQAIRIAVNDELGAFEEAISDAMALLDSGGRICVITFHSLEDRICKQVMKEASRIKDLPPGLPVVPVEAEPEMDLVTKKPIVPTEKELEENRRARSARLRIAQKR